MKQTRKTCRLLIAAGTDKGLAAILTSLRGLQVPEALQVMQAYTMTQVRQKVFPAAGAEPAEILIVGMPLKDEAGIDALLDMAGRNSRIKILLLVRQEAYEQVVYQCRNLGVFVLSLPVKKQILMEAVRFMLAMHRQLQERDDEVMRLRRTLSEIGLITKAKCLLIQEKHMSEEEAHYYLEKNAMDRSLSKKEVAGEIVRMFRKEM